MTTEECTIKVGDRFTGKGGGKIVWTVIYVFAKPGTHTWFEADSTDGQKRVFYDDQVDWIVN